MKIAVEDIARMPPIRTRDGINCKSCTLKLKALFSQLLGCLIKTILAVFSLEKRFVSVEEFRSVIILELLENKVKTIQVTQNINRIKP